MTTVQYHRAPANNLSLLSKATLQIILLLTLLQRQHIVLVAMGSSSAASESPSSSTTTTTTTTPMQLLNKEDLVLAKERVCIIGSGNWASAISITIGNNCQKLPFCHSSVNMYVYEEMIPLKQEGNDNGSGGAKREEKLSTIINTQHENVKYLPNISLPPNIIAVPNVIDAIRGATLLIFCMPHQFLKPILYQIRDHYHLLHPSGCRGVSLIKGMDFDTESKSPILISKLIEDTLNNGRGSGFGSGSGHDNEKSHPSSLFSCGVLMGANVANGVAKKQICESTLATDYKYSYKNDSGSSDVLNQRTRAIFHAKEYFRIQHTTDIYGAEACGALKNVVALGCGFVDSLYMDVNTAKEALDEGSNTKAALIRIGLLEMKRFCKLLLNGVEDDTFWQSCGIADLITTCYSGRNYKCSKIFGYEQRRQQEQEQQHQEQDFSTTAALNGGGAVWDPSKCKSQWSRIESSLLNGQKLQGTLTCQEVYLILSSRNLLRYFPLMKVIYEIAFEGKHVNRIVDGIVFVDYDGGNGSQLDHSRHRSRL